MELMAPLDLADRRIFVANLRFVHALIRASEPLIEEVLKRDMPEALRAFYVYHLEEECGHADWLANDLAYLGARVPDVDWDAAQIAGMQYYLVRHAAPELLLGYMAALECRPMPLDVVQALEKTHGIPAVRTIRHHAEHDPNHGKELLAMIADSRHGAEIAINAQRTAGMLAHSLERIR